MSNKQKIIDFMRGKEKVAIKDISGGIGLASKFVGSIICINKELFEKVERGVYKLK